MCVGRLIPSQPVVMLSSDPVAEHYLRSQAKYANGVSSPHISPCDSAYDRDRDGFLKHDSQDPSGLELASSAHDEVFTQFTFMLPTTCCLGRCSTSGP